METPGRKFRRLLKEEEYLFTGGVYSPLDAQIAEKVGMKSIYLSGYSVAMANGWPDMGFLTQTEIARIGGMPMSTCALISRQSASVWKFIGVPESVPMPSTVPESVNCLTPLTRKIISRSVRLK